MRILLFRSCYLPGFKSGGPIQTVTNLVANLGDKFDFFIVTQDRDSGDKEPYPDVVVDDWNTVGQGEVYYASPGPDFVIRIAEVWREVDPDMVYFNSFFSPQFTILPLALRRLGIVPDARTVVAPRGQFHPGARRIKGLKKKIYHVVAELFELYRDVEWCATSPGEADFIREVIGNDVPIRIAPNLGRCRPPSRVPDKRPKQPGAARFVVVARVAPIKNLHRSLQWLQQLEGEVVFDIFGPISDDDYWARCRREMEATPKNVNVEYHGAIPHEQVHAQLGKYDFFLMPSDSENHGHAIMEAMMAGCPPIISQGTPWRDLEENGVGWDLPLDKDQSFVSTLQRCIEMGPDEYALLSANSHEYGARKACSPEALEKNRRLFTESSHQVQQTGE